jgi:hypothetical protein
MNRKQFEEEYEEEYHQDMLDYQLEQREQESELFSIYTGKPMKKINSHKLHFKNRRNHHRFAKKHPIFSPKLPF